MSFKTLPHILRATKQLPLRYGHAQACFRQTLTTTQQNKYSTEAAAKTQTSTKTQDLKILRARLSNVPKHFTKYDVGRMFRWCNVPLNGGNTLMERDPRGIFNGNSLIDIPEHKLSVAEKLCHTYSIELEIQNDDPLAMHDEFAYVKLLNIPKDSNEVDIYEHFKDSIQLPNGEASLGLVYEKKKFGTLLPECYMTLRSCDIRRAKQIARQHGIDMLAVSEEDLNGALVTATTPHVVIIRNTPKEMTLDDMRMFLEPHDPVRMRLCNKPRVPFCVLDFATSEEANAVLCKHKSIAMSSPLVLHKYVPGEKRNDIGEQVNQWPVETEVEVEVLPRGRVFVTDDRTLHTCFRYSVEQVKVKT